MFEKFVDTYRNNVMKENLPLWKEKKKKSKCPDPVWQAIGDLNQPKVSPFSLSSKQGKCLKK